LARALSVSPQHLMRGPGIQVQWAAFRCQARLGEHQKEEIQAAAFAAAERQAYLLSLISPTIELVLPPKQHVSNAEEAEEAAEALRHFWNLGIDPIESLTRTVEDHNGIVTEVPVPDTRFDGLSAWVNESIPLLVINSNVPDDRRRFNLAHELGHLVMDCNGATAKEEEKLSHRFAGALLAPGAAVRKELGDSRRSIWPDELALLKKKYGLSMQAWVFRALDLGIISQNQFLRIRIEFTKRGWHKTEPVSYEGNEKPTRLHQMTLRALAEGIISTEKAEELCPGCVKQQGSLGTFDQPLGTSPTDMMRLPLAKRRELLAHAATIAESEYASNRELTDFEAFGEEDLDE
ncbi:MAG: ImmA/IrrE family metallo-endopeptidase, partial [Bryobacteraceae bacterium]|nr:ImmA/IrrE family metallo-endopeptidase [Bryobacteraceae bacterium]